MQFTITAKDTELRFAPQNTEAAGAAGLTITVKRDEPRQSLLGFGGAFTEAAAYTYSRMSKERQEEILRLYFDRETGLGYNLGRVAISSCDFSLEPYDYVQPGDMTLESFDMRREERWVLPMLRDAEEVLGGKLRLLASPWSPPAYMKTNSTKLRGGRLRPDMAALWAKHYVRFLEGMKNYGFPVEFLTVQNEPEASQVWESCLYTGAEERDFVKNHLGPALAEGGFGDVKLLVHDHNRDILLDRVTTMLSDPETAAYVWGSALHWYVSEDFDAVAETARRFPEKHLLFTEGCQEGGPHPGVWQVGERYARNIIGDLSAGVEGYIDWNLILDKQGGPNHVGNLCDAPILCDPETDSILINSSYYYIGHFSRYIAEGARRLPCVCDGETLGCLAALNPGGETVAVLCNESGEEKRVDVAIDKQTVRLSLPPHSIGTLVI